MGSKKKAEEDITPECEEHGNPPKKRKLYGPIDSLLLEVENQNMANLKYLFEQGLDLITPGNFPLGEQWRLVFIPALSDATISDQIIHILKKKYPKIKLVKKNEGTKNPDCLILPRDADTEQRIEVLELVGAACVCHGETEARYYGWSCWYKATNLREGSAILKKSLRPSFWEKIALKGYIEYQSLEDLKALFRQRERQWLTQSFFVIQRISKTCDCYPNIFAVYNLYELLLHEWEKRKLPRPRAFAASLHLFELIGQTEFLDQLVQNPAESFDVVHLTSVEFFNTLQNLLNSWNELKHDMTVLTFDNLMTSLVFSFVYQVKVHDFARIDQIKINDKMTIKSKADKLEEISELILVILKLLVSIPKSKTQSKKLKSLLAIYINIYELKRANQKPNLLLKVCTTHQGRPNEFKLIKLLLKAGADPNAVDQQRCSPLHLLANSELVMCTLWDCSYYATRSKNFAAIVSLILDGRFHKDQVNLRGQSALECLKPKLSLYPNAQLCQLVGNFLQQLQGVRPLSCIAAKVVRKHQLPCEGLPVTLQSMVLQH
ncbi:hypothetical protein DAPPUDRAFT_234500 [Daphnia pulex]|uniref:Uncharacterized protein n=1 Tax=Daphnia pulex TaxID=6669 RepID=E9FWS0_DAPPU|nr:hypothetical protein DAPPUDRAFT_234500 [Daphnia pulex]|eukprot:EFX88384.1 hypothetical protein DAPPUDRAFT_234500 [Daphnia pulex]